MIRINTKHCDERPVIIERRVAGTINTWVSTSHTPTQTHRSRPTVYKCSHTAGEAFVSIYMLMLISVLTGALPPSRLPRLEDFRLTYVDEEPNYLDQDVDDVSAAAEAILKAAHK